MEYCAIIGDIVKSRELSNRPEVQDKFIEIIERQVNDKYRQYIASNFTVTLGDEFQGLLYKEYTYLSYELIKYIKHQMTPVSLAFGVGVGEMLITPSHEISIRADGPAYHNARRMVSRAKEGKPNICYFTDSPEDELINSMLYLIEDMEEKMTPKQKKIIELYELLKSQSKAAESLGIRQSTVSRLLNNAGYYQVANAEANIALFLSHKYKLKS